jgi:hypothetical protein
MHDVLDYQRYGAYGGDWGASVSSWLGHAHPERLAGILLSFPFVPGPWPRNYAGRGMGA